MDKHEQFLDATSEDLQLLSAHLRVVGECLQRQQQYLHPGSQVKGKDLVRPILSTLLIGRERERLVVLTDLLVARCPYFAAMMSASMREAQQADYTFSLPDLTLPGVKAVVDYVYSASFTVNTTTVAAILEAAKYLQMTGVELRCVDYIKEHLQPCNVISLLATSWQLQSQVLQGAVLDFIATHAQACLKSVALNRGWAELNLQLLLLLLQRPDLEVTEEEVYRFVCSWCEEHMGEADAEAAANVAFGHVSYAALPRQLLHSLAHSHLPRGMQRHWLVEALQAKNDELQWEDIPWERRCRLPTPVILMHGPAQFRSRHDLELHLNSFAKWEGALLNMKAAAARALVKPGRAHAKEGPSPCDATCSFHCEAWVRPHYLQHQEAATGPLLSKHQPCCGWELRVGAGGVEFVITLRKQEHTWLEVVALSAEICPGQWYHVAASYDGAVARVYLNGHCSTARQPAWNNNQLHHTPQGAKPVPHAGNLSLGRSEVWEDRFLVCDITGVRIFTDRVVPPCHFLQLPSVTASGAPAQMMAWS